MWCGITEVEDDRANVCHGCLLAVPFTLHQHLWSLADLGGSWWASSQLGEGCQGGCYRVKYLSTTCAFICSFKVTSLCHQFYCFFLLQRIQYKNIAIENQQNRKWLLLEYNYIICFAYRFFHRILTKIGPPKCVLITSSDSSQSAINKMNSDHATVYS